eukprot:m.38950 g.38950  ORF g.38950 m.38950 type:complete len:100 (-) comp10250_c0_seq9:126-425(-)
MKMSTGTSSPLYWKTVENLNDERRRNLSSRGGNEMDTSYTASLEFGDDGTPVRKKTKGTSSSSSATTTSRKPKYTNHLNPGDRRFVTQRRKRYYCAVLL